MSTMVNFGIGFQESWTRPGVKLDEKMSYLIFDSVTREKYKFQIAGRRCESEKMSCHAIPLKNLYEPKMDVIWTISFKLTAQTEIKKKHVFCVLLCRRGRVSAFCKA